MLEHCNVMSMYIYSKSMIYFSECNGRQGKQEGREEGPALSYSSTHASKSTQPALVTRPIPYRFTTVFQCLISGGFQLLISNN